MSWQLIYAPYYYLLNKARLTPHKKYQPHSINFGS